MTRSEVVILQESALDPGALDEVRSILSQMGIVYREETLPALPSLAALHRLAESVSQSVCIVCAGRSAHVLPTLAASISPQQPLIIMPCPGPNAPETYLETVFDAMRGYPVAYTRPFDAQGAALLAVHLLASRHPSYADILSAFVQKKYLQPA